MSNLRFVDESALMAAIEQKMAALHDCLERESNSTKSENKQKDNDRMQIIQRILCN